MEITIGTVLRDFRNLVTLKARKRQADKDVAALRAKLKRAETKADLLRERVRFAEDVTEVWKGVPLSVHIGTRYGGGINIVVSAPGQFGDGLTDHRSVNMYHPAGMAFQNVVNMSLKYHSDFKPEGLRGWGNGYSDTVHAWYIKPDDVALAAAKDYVAFGIVPDEDTLTKVTKRQRDRAEAQRAARKPDPCRACA